MKRFGPYLFIISIIFNCYFIFSVISFSSNENNDFTNQFNSENNNSLINPEDFFENKNKNVIDLKKVRNAKLIFSPQKLNQLINYSLRNTNDSLEVSIYYVKNFLPKILKSEIPLEYNFEVYNAFINAGIRYKEASTFLSTNEIIFNSFHQIIFEDIANKLTINQKNNLSLSNSLDFQILVNKCIENNFFPDLHESSSDKFLKTLLEKDYFHLLNTSYQKSSLGLKLIVLISCALMGFGLISLIKLFK